MTLPHPNTTNPNQQGFNLPLPVEANTSCTIGGQPFIDYWPENFSEMVDSIDTGGILGQPSLSLPNECRPVEIVRNYTGNDMAHEQVDGLIVDKNFSVDNFPVDDGLLMPVGILENYAGNDIARVHSDNLVVDDNNFLVDDDALMPVREMIPAVKKFLLLLRILVQAIKNLFYLNY